MNRKILVAVAALTFVLGLIVGSLYLTRGQKVAMKTLPDRRYALNVAFSGAPAFGEARQTWERIGKVTPGVETLFGGPLDGDSNKQIEELELLIEKKVSGIVIYPSDPLALVPTINKAVAQGIPVITLFSDVAKSNRLTCVKEAEVDSGHLIAVKVFKDYANVLPTSGEYTVLISVASLSMENQTNRAQGIEEEIEKVRKEHADLKIRVEKVVDGLDDAKGAEAFQAALAKPENKNVKIIFGCNSRSAVAAVSVLKAIDKKPGQIVLTGWDSDNDLLRLIQEDPGWVHATVILYVSAMTQTAFGLLESYSLGYMYPESLRLREFGVPPVPASILVPVNLVDKSNVGAYAK